jgi:hypothetical protein
MRAVQPVYRPDIAACSAFGVPRGVVGTTVRALPMWVRFSRCCPTKCVTLGNPARLGVATFLFFDFGEQQVKSALHCSLGFGDFDLMTRLTG